MQIGSYGAVRWLVAMSIGTCGVPLGCATRPMDPPANRAHANSAPAAAVVLVHGAFADGSAWADVISRLESDGYTATAVQNPLFSFEQDVETTKRVIEAQRGPVVVVGHSYGGAVITAAAAGNPNVKALVYVTAFAPDTGEKVGELYEKFGKPALPSALIKDSAGFLSIDPAKFHDAFANDVSPERAAVLAATQKPIFEGAFGGAVSGEPAWKSIPSWFLLCQRDRAISVQLQQFMAKRIAATVVDLDSSHVPFLSHPAEVTALIEKAAVATTAKAATSAP
jgi:pimeloyl-ACP methyl ester carboxylesterase